ncbi:MAG: hypothetical protein V2I43_06155, partial [Parvularcula sp.]|nr:hypothetical protein [Parvularcula sp.]
MPPSRSGVGKSIFLLHQNLQSPLAMTTRPTSAPAVSRHPARPIVRNKRKIPKQATSQVAYELAPPAPDDPLLAFVPVPHARPRRNSITPDVQRAFIAQ